MKTTTSSDDFSQYTLVLFLFAFENIVFRYPSTNPFQLKQIHNESSANSGNVGPNPRKVTASPYAIRNEDLLSPNTENLDPEMSSSGEILQQQPTSDGKEKLDASQNNNNSNNSMKSKLRRKNNKKNTTQDDAGASSSASLLDTGNNNHRNSQNGATIHRHNKKKNLTTSNDTDGKPTAEEATAKSLRRPFSTVSFASEVHTSDHGLNEVEGEYIPSVLSSSALDASYNGMIASAVESLTNNSLNTTTNNNASGAAVDTSCVGVAPLTLMHLLGGLGNTVNSRNSSSHNNIVGCTTVSVDNITFLVFPVPLRGDKQTATKPNSKSTSDTQCHPNNNKSVATFVLAMSSPDVENGNISRFFQCFINIILREEVRLSYISAQLSLISNVWALYENNTNPSSTNNEDGGMTGSHPGNRSLYNTNKGQRQQKQAKKNKIENTLLTAENLKQKINPKCPAKAIFDSTESLPSGATDTPRSGEQKKGEEERAAEEPERTGSSEESGDRPRRGVPSAASSRSDSPPASSAPSYRRPTVANDPMNNPNATATGTKSSVYDFLLQAALQQDKGTRFTLGKELMEVVDVIHTWNVKFRPLPRRKVLQELLLLSENRSREGVTPVLPRGIPVNQLLFLPLSHLTGVQLPPSSVTPAGAPVETNHPGSMDEEESGVMGDESRQGLLFSLFARLHPCGLIYLAKDLKKFNTSGEESSEFLTHLEREYEIILGKRYSRLLPPENGDHGVSGEPKSAVARGCLLQECGTGPVKSHQREKNATEPQQRLEQYSDGESLFYRPGGVGVSAGPRGTRRR
ncbi:hypothetical protein ADEAN_000802600 [Angomonas deanei]|uniref:Uncharacterized protein n=1 Tax=Angomonas deanei TaxID=59799 RepID=A0A7G2CNH6_9TRYP|nr:hypothetical protein ADEAN_000802600 [Angomonas deanei]